MNESPAAAPAWVDAAWAATLWAVEPQGLGGIALRASAGPVRDHWTRLLRTLFDGHTPWRRMPAHIADDRLLGGLDLTATLQAGRPVAQRGLLAECDGGVLLLPMARSYGIDPVHFGIIFLAAMELGFLCPPAGMNIYFAAAMFDKSVPYVTVSVLPAALAIFIGTVAIALLPELATALPAWWARR